MYSGVKALGIACITVGAITTLLSYFSLKYAMPLSIVGILMSGVYVFIDTKNQIHKSAITPGILGMILSSIPVLFVLVIIMYQYFKHS